MIFKNFRDVAVNSLRCDGLEILNEGLAAIAADQVVGRVIRVDGQQLMVGDEAVANLGRYKKVVVVGAGKVAYGVASKLAPLLGAKLAGGIVVGTVEEKMGLIEYVQATHPLPSQKNVEASRRLLAMVSAASKDDLVLAIITGGGSSMLALPHKMSVEAQAELTNKLMKAGADIFEVNTVRKHTSEIKGGWLAQAGRNTNMVGLIFSDVIGDDLSMVASGPTVMDRTSAMEAESILKKYGLWEECLQQGCQLLETPKDTAVFENIKNLLVVSNRVALEKMASKAEELGYEVNIIEEAVRGEARLAGRELLTRLVKPGQIVIAGGETTVKVSGKGRGGRNQELVLGALDYLQSDQLVISCASDGVDNKTQFAGALGDLTTVEQARAKSLNPEVFLENNDAANFFEQEGSGLETGLLDSNVADLMLAVRRKSEG